jgi:hypothetical protein
MNPMRTDPSAARREGGTVFRTTSVWLSILGVVLSACQARSGPLAAPTLTAVPTFAVPTLAASTPVPTRELPTLTPAPPTATPAPTDTVAALPTQESHADWIRYHDVVGAFAISYPPTWEHSDSGGYPAIFSVRVPPGTTLGEKMMWINVVSGVSECKNPNAIGPNETGAPEHVTTTGEVTFLKESWSDAGAGNVYHITGYSTLHGTTCVSITFILHSSNPQMYDTPPPDYDAVAESAVFGEILDTFAFDQ